MIKVQNKMIGKKRFFQLKVFIPPFIPLKVLLAGNPFFPVISDYSFVFQN